MTYTECPHCGITWEGKEVPLGLHLTGNYTMEEAIKVAAHYGWTPENKRCFSINMVGVETDGYDGISYWYCLACDAMIDRFTGKITAKEAEEVEEAEFVYDCPTKYLVTLAVGILIIPVALAFFFLL